jgi:hypothetical protein
MRYVERVELVKYADKKKEMESNISHIEDKAKAFSLLREGLEKYGDGKKLTKRVVGPLKNAGYSVHYEKGRFDTTITIWGNGLDYSTRDWYTFSSSEAENFDLKTFDKKHTFYSPEKVTARIKAYEQKIKDLHKLCNAYNKAGREFNYALTALKKAESDFSILD